MNNLIAYDTPKKKVVDHSMTLNSRIFCILGIIIFSG